LAVPAGLEPPLDEREVAIITKRSVASIRRDRLMRKGVPFLKIGSSIRYRPEALRAFLTSREEDVPTGAFRRGTSGGLDRTL